MRSISLVEKLIFDYKGTIFQNAICLIDIDNDGLNELCVGFTNGELHVYKGIENSKPWKTYKDLGSLIVLCGGCIRDCDEKLLCTLDSEGRCRLFDVVPADEFRSVSFPGSFVDSRPSSPCTNELRFVHQEQLHANAKAAILEDIDNDGVAELIVGFTDRYVRIYKWQIEDAQTNYFSGENVVPKTTPSNTKSSAKNSIDLDRKSALSISLSLKEQKNKELCNTPLGKGNTSEFHQHQRHSTPSGVVEANDNVDSGNRKSSSPYHPVGKFVLIKQFSLLGQIGSLAVCKTAEGLNQLIVSQPNGGYCILGQYDGETGFSDSVSTPTSMESSPFNTQESYPTFYPITSNTVRSSHHVNTEIIGGIKRQKRLTGVIGLCTQDGNFIILDNTYFSGLNPVKNRSDKQWLVMSKLDFTDDGNDEIVLCSMDGMTYIIDKERNIVSYNFNEYVAAFCAGYYGINDVESPCVCYVTLSGKIYLYYNVWINTMIVKCVHTALIKKIKQRPELHYLLDLFKLPNGGVDHEKLQYLLKNINALNITS